jgi:hypothetical protein
MLSARRHSPGRIFPNRQRRKTSINNDSGKRYSLTKLLMKNTFEKHCKPKEQTDDEIERPD